MHKKGGLNFIHLLLLSLSLSIAFNSSRIARRPQLLVMSSVFNAAEIEGVARSIERLVGATGGVNIEGIKNVIGESAHTSHKDWKLTEIDAESFRSQFCDEAFEKTFRRVFEEGNYSEALRRKQSLKPWVVLVTGVNGIRKTTALHQPWFGKVLGGELGLPAWEVPTGSNSFYRQLDHIIASLTNVQFQELYEKKLSVSEYSEEKARIFSRYRKLSEMAGVSLLEKGKADGVNVLVETSGRDVSMFEYIEHFFPPTSGYKKLAIHFTIDDLKFAERSVDARMAREMCCGLEAMNKPDFSPNDVVNVNLGGPYGSSFLKQVHADSERVWTEVQHRRGWQFATIDILGSDDNTKWICKSNFFVRE